MKIFEFAAIYVPNAENRKAGDKPEIIVQPTVILAKDSKDAEFKAARAVPDSYVDKFDQVEVAVRPF